MPDIIRFYSRKDGYGWLSNFWRQPQLLHFSNGSPFAFPTNEAWYQSRKALTSDLERWIALAPNPYAAMKAGRALRRHEIRPDWDDVKVDIMLVGLRHKFALGSELAEMLLATGHAVLEEDSPTDLYWGRLGQNMLGKLLMQVRDELRNAAPEAHGGYTTTCRCGRLLVGIAMTNYDARLGTSTFTCGVVCEVCRSDPEACPCPSILG